MCGRFTGLDEDDYIEIHKIVDEVSKKFNQDNVKHGEVFPTDNVAVLYSHDNKKVLSSAKWGFPNFKNSGVIINARAESITEKSMFRNSFISKRCIVPAKSYYEWLTHEDKKKTKYSIGIQDKQIIYMAGIYNIFTNKEGQQYPAVTIITTDANANISFIHNRMPVILQTYTIDLWLNERTEDLSQVQSLLYQHGGEMIYKVV